MAKFVVTFSDVEDQVQIEVQSDVQIPENITPEFLESLTEAERMGIRLTELISQEAHGDCGHDHDCGHCGNDGCCST